MNQNYKCLRKQIFSNGNYSIVPIRMEDRFAIMQWRNDQIFHLRQNTPLTANDQDKYFNTIVNGLYNQERPNQILFSYLEGKKCIGYGGLVHINWADKNAEISFIMDTKFEKEQFEFHWISFLSLIDEVAFVQLGMHKIYTYAFDLRPKLYSALEKAKFIKEAVLLQHACFEGKFINVIIHSILVSKRTEYKIRRCKTLNLYSNGKEETQISQLQDKCHNGAVARRIN